MARRWRFSAGDAVEVRDRTGLPGFSALLGGSGRSPDTLRPLRPHQLMPRHEQVGERTGHEQAMRILLQSAVTDLGEAEHPLDDTDAVLDLGPHLRLGPVLRPLGLVAATAWMILVRLSTPTWAFMPKYH